MLKPKIRNIIATSDLHQVLDITKFSQFPWGTHDVAIYHGICGYVKSVEMSGRVTVFSSGKMISIGAKSIKESFQQLELAKYYLLESKIISKNQMLSKKIRNIVATLEFPQRINLKKLFKKIKNSTYAPEQFPALILKTKNFGTFLIFSSGKIVITGIRTLKHLKCSSEEIENIVNNYLKPKVFPITTESTSNTPKQ